MPALPFRSILAFFLCTLFSSWAQQLDKECFPQNQTYDWESLNYYELIGVKNNKDLESKDVRKAYRKEAQLWHPDKFSTNKHHNATMDECTARFAKIAQAYEVLNDPSKRQEYNAFLKYCQEAGASSSNNGKKGKKWSSIFESFGDPRQVFEEFFFGRDSELKNEDDQWWKHAYSNFQNDEKPQQKLRTSQYQEFLQDKYTGEEIIRILKAEEYSPDPNTGRFYYRVYAQEFKKNFDPFTGISYVPISEKYLRDEGYRYTTDKEYSYTTQSRNQKQQKENQKANAQTILFPGDLLTPRSTLLVSPNKRYYAGLSPECELLVMADNGRKDDDLIWSSQITLNKMYTPNCFATLRGPHLVIGMERPGHSQHQVLWFSEAEDEDDEDSYIKQRRQHSTYLAQLDNDGSLVVYQVWNVQRRSHSLPARAWMATNNLLRGQARADYDVMYSPFSITYRRCVYATGPLGCFRVARRLHELSLTIYYTIKRILSKVDTKLDTFMDLVLEEWSSLRR